MQYGYRWGNYCTATAGCSNVRFFVPGMSYLILRIRISNRKLAIAGIAPGATGTVSAVFSDLFSGRGQPRPVRRGLRITALGRKVFFDTSLSGSGVCRAPVAISPAHAYGPPNGLAVQLGGPGLDRQGARAVPSLRYRLNRTPAWHTQFVEIPRKGFSKGTIRRTAASVGMADSYAPDQASFPLLARNEMANAGPAAVGAKLQHASYANDFRKTFGTRFSTIRARPM